MKVLFVINFIRDLFCIDFVGVCDILGNYFKYVCVIYIRNVCKYGEGEINKY